MATASDSEIRKDAFAWFGGTIYAIQCFETELIIALLAHARIENPKATVKELDEVDEQLAAKPLGRLIDSIRKTGVIGDDDAEKLKTWNKKRIYVVHHYFSSPNDQKLMSKEGCEEMIVEMESLTAEFRAADAMAQVISAKLRKKAGISEAALQSLVDAEMATVRADLGPATPE